MNFAIIADCGVADDCPFADMAIVSDDVQSGYIFCLGFDDRIIADITISLPDPFQMHIDISSKDIEMNILIFVQAADIFPIPVTDTSVEFRVVIEQQREKIFTEIELLLLRNQIEHFGLDNVNSGIDRIAKNFSPRRFFEEARNFSIVIRHHDAELERIRMVCQEKRSFRLFLFVKFYSSS